MPALAVLFVAATLAVGPSQDSRASVSGSLSADASHTQPDSPSDSDGQSDLPVSLNRIKEKLSEPPAIKLDAQRGVYRVEVVGRRLTIEDILGPDYLKGPTPPPAGGMTHQEFLNMVTPQDVQGYAAFSNKEAATVAATSFALQWALQKAIHKYQEAKEDRARDAARKEVQDALAELEKARIKAGLPPK
jgi:hypothetical protein